MSRVALVFDLGLLLPQVELECDDKPKPVDLDDAEALEADPAVKEGW